jgi:hypothetical protein
MERVALDPYVLDVLMPDLVGHDHRPSAFILFLLLWRKTSGASRSVFASYRVLSEGTGLSMRAVQEAVKLLERRQLVEVARKSPTAVPSFTLRCPWRARA